jgi:hypothetical protein
MLLVDDENLVSLTLAGLFSPRRIDNRDRGAAHGHSHQKASQQRTRNRLVNQRSGMFKNRTEGKCRDHEERKAGAFDEILRPMALYSVDHALLDDRS